MKFPYLKFEEFWKPVIPVTFVSGDKKLTYRALIDSGSDINIVHAAVGEYLGIDIKKGIKHPISGISGNATGYIHKISIEIGGWIFDDIPISFSEDIAPYGFGVFGQIGFFDKFIIKFDYQKKIIEIVPKRSKN